MDITNLPSYPYPWVPNLYVLHQKQLKIKFLHSGVLEKISCDSNSK